MNYFKKNFRRLIEDTNLTQEEFGALFGLSRTNIKSYANGNFPKLETYIKMMDYFQLDPSKFIKLDMERASIKRDEGDVPTDRDEIRTLLLKVSLTNEDHFEFLDNYDINQLKDLAKETLKSKDILMKENLMLKEENIKIKNMYIQLLEGKLDIKNT